MPFTLAHPAAVLPLRRFLWFPGLVAGAMAPDLGYYVPVLPTHDVLGGSLAAVVLLLVGRLLLPSVMALAPEFVRTRVSRPGDFRRPVLAALSIVVGVLTHLLWDVFTQTDGWFVQQWDWLTISVVGPHRVYNVIGYVSSLGGLVLLAWIGLVAPRGNDWPSHPKISRYKIRAFVALAAIVGAAWSLSDPVSQASTYDWVRNLLLGVIQGTCAAVAVHAVLWGFKQSRHDRS
ncbi:hypothetical protein UK23_18395 [Lentzea aerocolonigenes]|uniref:DUF4184 family protein n=1 Tax=Lentzea aerocolonigenes TaxID=68170 RepID=A0A0F0GX41_LENAE|nr:DUF4184 family protein [Lentzea aerocolonigenes]KJK48019.1 hypothetical protein UK23_18395 [Lentzea aerocolonigenes]